MRILILGKNGQLGREFVKVLNEKNITFYAFGRKECDVTNLRDLHKALDDIKPDVVINCTAYNLVDKAEDDFANAYSVNACAVKNLAELCAERKVFFVHFSTDYVFDGTKDSGLYTEKDKPNPINEYGKSKYTGETYVQKYGEDFLIFRVSWVYGEGKQNFIYKLLNWTKNQEYIKVAYDEVSVPTSTRTIVDVTLRALDTGLSGLYHLTNSGYASRYEYAKEVLKAVGINKFIKPVSMDIFNLPAKRPKFSAMSNTTLSKLLNIDIPEWNDELKRFLSDSKLLS